ncbi:MAG: amino acid adenylation domain-containing protein [Pseudomonadota bacterium]
MNRPPEDTASYLARLSPEKRRLLIRELSRKKRATTSGTLLNDKIRARRRAAPVPLSFAQERLWFLDQLEGPKAAYNIPMAWHLSGRLDLEALRKSIGRILQRHEALRTRVVMEKGNPVQVIPSHLDLAIPVTDLCSLPEPGRRAEMARRIEKEDLKPFDLTAGPLVRAELLRLDPEVHVLLLTFHHMVFDGWSLGILSREIMAAYSALLSGGEPDLPELPVQYADFTLWQRERFQGDRLDQKVGFWKKQLSGAPALLDLSLDRPHPPRRSYQGRRLTFTIPREWTGKLKKLARDAGATLFMALLAVYALLLSRYTSQRDMVIGTPVAGRDRPELEPLIGFFINTLVLRIRLSGSPCFREFLKQVKQVVLEARTHQDIPFEKLVESLSPERNLSHTPLFQASFVFQNMPMAPLSLPGLVITPLETDRLTAKFDLNLIMEETGSGLLGNLEYSTDIFEADTISRMARHFQNLLRAAISDPEQPMLTLPMLIDGEMEQIRLWNNTESAYPEDRTVVDLFEEQAKKTPERVALVFKHEQMTYRELNARADQLACYLRERESESNPHNPLMGICMERSLEMVVGILGILKAGGAYVPLDPDYPKERLGFMLDDSGVKVLLTQEKFRFEPPTSRSTAEIPQAVMRGDLSERSGDPASRFAGRSLTSVCLDRDWQKIRYYPETNPERPPKPTDLAYVIYTSGSTGRPKGVMIEHRGLLNYAWWASENYTQNGDHRDSGALAFPLFTSLSFDLTVTSLFVPLISGNKIIIYGEDEDQWEPAIHRVIKDNAVDVIKITPAHLTLVREMDVKGSRVKRMIIGGEDLKTGLAGAIHHAFGGAIEIYNEYGPTEATVGCMIHRFNPEEDTAPSVPIGRPAGNVKIYVMDPYQNLLPAGVPGEMVISGDGVARGYLNRPDLNAGAFISNPWAPGERLYRSGDLARRRPDGNLEFLGRVDDQIKLRGFRIEPREIESALCRYPEILEAVVSVHEDPPGNGQLVAYLVCSNPVESEKVCDFLKTRLPGYMIPSLYIELDKMPLTSNNKIDRKRLPKPESITPARQYTPPRNRTEEILAGIWGRVLKQDRVGRDDDFFRIGGHSLLAAQVLSRVREAFQVSPPLRRLFEEPTIAGLAGWIDKARNAREKVMARPEALEKTGNDDWEKGEI